MKEMGKSKALIVNMLASILTFLVSLGISFFFTPYLTDTVGEEAYGFVSLGNNFINYITIITVALNSVAGRFITIEYHKGKKEEASKYFSSVLAANVIMSAAILVVAIPVIGFLERIINISPELVVSVKYLFSFILANFIITIIGTVFTVATFITNTLYLSSIANIVTALLRVLLLGILYGTLPPNVAYIGLATCICTFVGLVMNLYYTKRLIPDISISKGYVSFGKVKELFAAGMWNSITKLAQVLSDGLDLLITNLWISPYLMGVLSIAQQIPMYMGTLVSMITNLFNPNATMYYAKGDKDAVVRELKTSMKLCSFFSNIIFCGVLVFGKHFYQLWVPNQEYELIYVLAVVSMISVVVSGVTTSLNNVFLITNKLKVNSLFWMGISVLNVILVFALLNTTSLGIYAVAGVSKVTGAVANLTFIPIYASMCLKVKWYTFYPLIFRYMGTTVIMGLVFVLIGKIYWLPMSWMTFLILCIVAGMVGVVINYLVLLDSYERNILVGKILGKLRKRKEA